MKFLHQQKFIIFLIFSCFCVSTFSYGEVIKGAPLGGRTVLAEFEKTDREGKSADKNNVVRGVVKARKTAVISSEVAARVVKVPFAEGQRFRRGDLLLEFDCASLEAQLLEVRADLFAKERSYNSVSDLLKLNSAGNLEVDLAKAEYEKAQAAVTIKALQVDQCEILAPYDGAVVQTSVNAHESIAIGQELLEIVGVDAADIELIVPSNWLVWLRVGYALDFYVDETGESYPLIIDRVSAVVDPVSQTVTIYGRLSEDKGRVLPGMSGSAVVVL